LKTANFKARLNVSSQRIKVSLNSSPIAIGAVLTKQIFFLTKQTQLTSFILFLFFLPKLVSFKLY